MQRMTRLGLATAVTAMTVAAMAAPAAAFCGFYIDTGGAKLTNDATQVVLMRKGTRTVLSMQNNYKGPAEEFAMVVPVPTVLQEATSRRCRATCSRGSRRWARRGWSSTGSRTRARRSTTTTTGR